MSVESANIDFQVGAEMSDGTIYAGISLDTHEPMFTTRADASLSCTFKQAQEYVQELEAKGYEDWRIPTKGELKVLFQNRAAIGGFLGDEYWSSSHPVLNYDEMWVQRFDDGGLEANDLQHHASLRFVR